MKQIQLSYNQLYGRQYCYYPTQFSSSLLKVQNNITEYQLSFRIVFLDVEYAVVFAVIQPKTYNILCIS